MNRLDEIMSKSKQYLKDGETLIYIKNGEMSSLFNDGEGLTQVNGIVNDKLEKYLEWLYDENKY